MNLEEAKLITNGNPHAAGFLLAFVRFCHLLDDVIDKDVPVNDERLAKESLDLIEELLLNPFVQEHRIVLWPLIVVAFNAWLDANKWENSRNKVLQRDADVLKGVYHEVCWMTARLCGGWEHMRKVTTENREYDHDFVERNK